MHRADAGRRSGLTRSFHAVDVSPAALRGRRAENARRLGVSAAGHAARGRPAWPRWPMAARQVDLVGRQPALRRSPPSCPRSAPEVRDHEPPMALAGPRAACGIYRRLAGNPGRPPAGRRAARSSRWARRTGADVAQAFGAAGLRSRGDPARPGGHRRVVVGRRPRPGSRASPPAVARLGRTRLELSGEDPHRRRSSPSRRAPICASGGQERLSLPDVCACAPDRASQ